MDGVLRATNSTLGERPVIAHARFCLRARYSVKDVGGLVLQSDLNGLPLVVTPLWWDSEKRDAVSIQVLQGFETDAHVRHSIANLEGNARSCAVEGSQHDVERARDGSNLLAVTEIDESTVEIDFDLKAACQDELHAQYVCTRWAQFVCRWTQKIVLPKLLLH
ncbi:hypothetical protein PRIC1_004573 [Phytophthora ramorum]